jgi:chemotaxis protein CheC
MTGWKLQLGDDQIDSLKEVGNIGAGRAASRLAGVIGRKCVVSLPQLVFSDIAGIKQEFGLPDSLAVALHMRILGDIPASMLVITKRPDAERLIGYLRQDSIAASDAGDSDFQLALKELGEMLTTSFSDAISQFLGTKARSTVPEAVMEDWSATVDSIIGQNDGQNCGQMAIHADFFDEEQTFRGKFIYVLGPNAQLMMLRRIDSLLG